MNPELKVYTGPMHGGKTTRLLSALERYTYQKKKVMLFKPVIDDRYSVDCVVSHSGRSWSAHRVETGEALFSIASDSAAQVVGIDEAFMIPGSASAAIDLYRSGITVMISSLQLSYEGTPFDEMSKILPYATSVEICPAVCARCDSDAYFTKRTSGGNNIIEVGGSESYEPRCLKHYEELKKGNYG
jgi:thymidine kinase